LQRRVAALVRQGRLLAVGHARARRYRIPATHTGAGRLVAGEAQVSAQGEVYLPISAEAQAIKDAIRKPLHERQPVGYQSGFLEAYQPNETFYLPAATRHELYELGHSLNPGQPAGTHALKIFSRLLIDLSWNSSRLEGNTYSLLETERLLELGEAAEGKDTREAQMILNHKAAIELLVEQADETGFNPYTILNLHTLLSDNLLADPQACGRLRTSPVGIQGTIFHPLEVPQLIEEYFHLILDKATAITDPFEQAFFALVHLPCLQPFEDVNKRVSRLAANIPLIRHNLSPLSFVDVPTRAYIDGILAVYELNRVELLRDVFVWAYKRSCARYAAVSQSLGEPDPFRLRYRVQIRELAAEIVRKTLDKKGATAMIRQQASEIIAAADQARFIEVVETELMSLHVGNIARYRLRPSEYETWRSTWI
jgi:Fic family protein